jgi:hypothetical protein
MCNQSAEHNCRYDGTDVAPGNRTNLTRKLGLQTQTDLTRYAMGWGIISPEN